MAETAKTNDKLDELFDVGAHFGFSKSRRHPSVISYIFTSKNRVDLFDLEKTQEALEKALAFVSSLAESKAEILFVAAKTKPRIW